MSDYGLIEPFDIDNGELDGLTPQQCFVLGYELATISKRAVDSWAFECYVHADNIYRVSNALQKRDREFTLRPMANDQGEDWWWLQVKERVSE